MPPISSTGRPHPDLWLDDGNIILRSQDTLFNLHRSMLIQTSPYFNSKLSSGCSEQYWDSDSGSLLIDIDAKLLSTKDLEALLYQLYHYKPLLADSSFEQVSGVLRASTRLEFPIFRKAAINLLETRYPRRPAPYAATNWTNVSDATQLAIDCRVKELLPTLLYGLILTTDFDIHEDVSSASSCVPNGTSHTITTTTTSLAQICSTLLQRIIDHFTPVLFTVATGNHMACTELLADHWMTQVIQPALEDSGVSKPLETLQRIKDIDWKSHGLCEECCVAKRQEWDNEADEFWVKFEGWSDADGELFLSSSSSCPPSS